VSSNERLANPKPDNTLSITNHEVNSGLTFNPETPFAIPCNLQINHLEIMSGLKSIVEANG
jgi:hypothetical protein